MRPYLFATVATFLVIGPAMAQSYGGAWDGKAGSAPSPTAMTGGPQQAQVPQNWQPYSLQLNQGNGPMTMQPNQNYPDNGQMTAPREYYGTDHGSGTPSQ